LLLTQSYTALAIEAGAVVTIVRLNATNKQMTMPSTCTLFTWTEMNLHERKYIPGSGIQ
jgi:hypothetical protein